MQSTKLNYFKDCKTLQDVKQLYKELAKLNHPDLGGTTEKMQEINAEYLKACKLVANSQNFTNEEFENEILNAELYKNAIEAVINLEGLIIEVVGGWIWITGNTYPHKTALKSANFMFASKKKAWYFRSAEFKVSNRNKNYSLEDIKSKYGSTLISSGAYKPQFKTLS